METQLLYIVAALAAGTLIGSFVKMKNGFGPFNLRVIGIILVTSFSALLAVVKQESLNACLGILGAVAGYLFGSSSKNEKDPAGSSVGIESSSIGDGNKFAGRDINETVQNLQAEVAKFEKLFLQANTDLKDFPEGKPLDYLINTVYGRGDQMFGNIADGIRHWESRGWKFKNLSSDYHGMDGVFLVFQRSTKGAVPAVECYHGAQHRRVE